MSIDELHEWLTAGLTACTMETTDGQRIRPAIAFRNARLSFGQSGDHRTPVEELTALFAELDDAAKYRFHQAIEKAIDRLPLEPRTMPVLEALIELGLDTKCNLAIDAIEKKFSVPSLDARRLLYMQAAFFLDESDAPEAVFRLANTMMDNNDYPSDISARLLVALCRYDVDEAATYARQIQGRLTEQLISLKVYATAYERFRNDFAAVMTKAANSSQVIEDLLSIPLYTELLDGRLRGVVPSRIVPAESIPIKRSWQVNMERICAAAYRIFFPEKSLYAADSVIEVEACLNAFDSMRIA